MIGHSTSGAAIVTVLDAERIAEIVESIVGPRFDDIERGISDLCRAMSTAAKEMGKGDDLEMLDARDLRRLLGINAREIRRMVSSHDFPRPLRLGARRLRWKRSDIDAWIERTKSSGDCALIDADDRR